MATLTNTKIKDTYKSLLKVSDNGNLEAGLQEITDGEGNASGVQLNTGGDLTASGTVAFGSLKDTGENITIAKFVDAADGIGSNNNDTSLPTSAAVATYVAAQITLEDLDFAGGSGTGSVDLDSQVLTIAGTTNEIETSASGQTLTIGLPNDVIIGNDLTVTTDASVGNNLGVTGALTAGTAQINGLLDVVGEVQATFLDINGNGELSGNFAVDTDTLFVDSTNDRVGINKTNPAVALDVTGAITSSSTITATTLAGTLSTAAQPNITSVGTLSSLAVSGDLTVDTSTLKVNSANNRVGIGTTTPRSVLETNGTISIFDSRTSVTTGDTLAGIEIYADDVNYNPPSGRTQMPVNRILPVCEQAEGDAFGMAFYTAGKDADSTEKVRIDSSGNVLIGTTSLPNGTTSYGSAFSIGSNDRAVLRLATSTTSSSSLAFFYNPNGLVGAISTSGTSIGIGFGGAVAANTLDDYEEGTWTMGVSFNDASVDATYSANTGKYTKVGNKVTVTGRLVLTNKGTSTGIAKLTGLPFTVPNNNQSGAAASGAINNVSFANQFQFSTQIGTQNVVITEITEAGVSSNMDETNFANNSTITISLTYLV